jgi:hypothetical protein
MDERKAKGDSGGVIPPTAYAFLSPNQINLKLKISNKLLAIVLNFGEKFKRIRIIARVAVLFYIWGCHQAPHSMALIAGRPKLSGF